jgi:hypothetical protein
MAGIVIGKTKLIQRSTFGIPSTGHKHPVIQ